MLSPRLGGLGGVLPPSPPDGDYPLPDCVHQLIHAGYPSKAIRATTRTKSRESIPEDLKRAEFILQKRLSGHAGGRENIVQVRHRRLARRDRRGVHAAQRAQAMSGARQRHHPPRVRARGVLIGYDRRFLSDRAAEAAAEVFAGNNIHTILLTKSTDAADQLRHRGRQHGVRAGLHRQPQPAGVERPQGVQR